MIHECVQFLHVDICAYWVQDEGSQGGDLVLCTHFFARARQPQWHAADSGQRPNDQALADQRPVSVSECTSMSLAHPPPLYLLVGVGECVQ